MVGKTQMADVCMQHYPRDTHKAAAKTFILLVCFHLRTSQKAVTETYYESDSAGADRVHSGQMHFMARPLSSASPVYLS